MAQVRILFNEPSLKLQVLNKEAMLAKCSDLRMGVSQFYGNQHRVPQKRSVLLVEKNVYCLARTFYKK